MKVATFAIACLLALLVLLPRPAAADGWYGAADIGYTGHPDVQASGVYPPTGPFANIPGTPSHPIAYRFDAGYRFTPSFSLEGGYTYLGSTRVKGVIEDCAEGLGHISCFSFPATASLRTSGLVLDAIHTEPLNDHWSFFIHGGLIAAHTVFNTAIVGTRSVYAANDSIRPSFGLGLDWAYSGDTAVRLSLNRFVNLRASYGTSMPAADRHYSVQVLSLGVMYSF